jgi:hypothetical protein
MQMAARKPAGIVVFGRSETVRGLSIAVALLRWRS